MSQRVMSGTKSPVVASVPNTIKVAMTPDPLTYADWLRDAPVERAKTAWLVDLFGEIRREKPRAKAEADFLRRIGTPERLIGPVVDDDRPD